VVTVSLIVTGAMGSGSGGGPAEMEMSSLTTVLPAK
jgi:hypothetical protein